MIRPVRWSIVTGFFASFVISGCAQPPKAAAPTLPNIILVSMDTLRADRLGAYGNTQGLSPNLDRFAQQSVVFDQAYSQAIQTAPSHGSMFTSRYPSEQVGTDHQVVLGGEHPSIAELLRVYGYQTAAFVAGGDLSPQRRLNVGFRTYIRAHEFGSLYHSVPQAFAWLEKADASRPYFMFVHGYDAHSVYLKPTPFGYLHADSAYDGTGQTAARTATERIVDGWMYPDFDGLLQTQIALLRPRAAASIAPTAAMLGAGENPTPVGEADVDHIRRVYDGAVSYADAMFGTFLAGLEERGQLENAVIVVMSDHGEQLGEHGIFGHCCDINDEESRVVLMVRLPGGEGGGHHVGGFAELVDVLPTIAELVGAKVPAGARGRSLVPALRGEASVPRAFAYTQGSNIIRAVSMRGAQGRLTYTGLAPGSDWVADVVEAARLDGPGFEGSTITSLADRAEARTALVARLRALEAPPDRAGGPISPELRKTLREKGYFEVQP